MDKKGWACCLPLSVLHVASTLIGEFDVKIIDQRVDPHWQRTLSASLSGETICVGVSSMTGHQIHNGLEISKFVKKVNAQIPVVWGGVHPTLLPEQTIQNPFIDYVITGEGEYSFRELVRRLSLKKLPEGVPGVVWKDHGVVKSVPYDNTFSLDDLPEIPYSLLNGEDYISPSVYSYGFTKRLLPFFSSRGCPHRCIFCAQAAMYRSGYRKMRPEAVYARVSKFVKEFTLDCVDFYDDEFAIDAAWITKVSDLINGQFMWTCQARMDDLARVDIGRLQRNGLRAVKVGLESGSNRVLEFLKKRETVEIYIEVNKRLAAAHLISQYNFMIGYPQETREDVFATVDLALQLLKENPYAVINSFALLTVYPGTEIARIAQEEGAVELPTTLEGWAGRNRQNVTTSWARREKRLYLYLQYSSHFLCSAKRYAAVYKFIPGFVFDLYAKHLKRAYEQKKFNNHLEYFLLRFIFKYILKA